MSICNDAVSGVGVTPSLYSHVLNRRSQSLTHTQNECSSIPLCLPSLHQPGSLVPCLICI